LGSVVGHGWLFVWFIVAALGAWIGVVARVKEEICTAYAGGGWITRWLGRDASKASCCCKFKGSSVYARGWRRVSMGFNVV